MPLSRDKVQVMGVLNVTPDSFSDGGRFHVLEHALQQAESMLEAGVDIIDVGGESTRPGAESVALEEEMQRVLPVVQALKARFDVPISVDTSKPELMQAVMQEGVSMVNDVRALQASGAIQACAEFPAVEVCLMHMQGLPATMQNDPCYEDVLTEVEQFLMQRVAACEAGGIARERIWLDPGFGFGKTLQHNVLLLKHLDVLVAQGFPVLAGMSRKRMIGSLLNERPVEDRVYGSVGAAVIAALKGAKIIRVHDVRETRDALHIAQAVL